MGVMDAAMLRSEAPLAVPEAVVGVVADVAGFLTARLWKRSSDSVAGGDVTLAPIPQSETQVVAGGVLLFALVLWVGSLACSGIKVPTSVDALT